MNELKIDDAVRVLGYMPSMLELEEARYINKFKKKGGIVKAIDRECARPYLVYFGEQQSIRNCRFSRKELFKITIKKRHKHRCTICRHYWTCLKIMKDEKNITKNECASVAEHSIPCKKCYNKMCEEAPKEPK